MFDWLWRNFISLINFFIDSAHTVLEMLTGKYRIENVVKSAKGASKNRRIESILKRYPNERINAFDWDTGDETEAAEAILEDTVSDGLERRDLSKSLAKSLRQIRGYQKLCREVEERRLLLYSPKNDEHEQMLLKLWRLLMPDEQLVDRRTDQWQKIGFQGDDPSTDFRGMGMLGLDQLIFFAQFDVDNCHRVLSLSHHPTMGFPFAICGITISALCKNLLLDDLLKDHFYNTMVDLGPLTMDQFHQVYCKVFTLFAAFWAAVEPESVMEFNEVKRRFVTGLEAYLHRLDANLLNARLEDLPTLAV